MKPGLGALKAGYFGYFAAVGVFQPYWSLELAAQGFGAAAIGTLLATGSGARVVAPLVQARISAILGDSGRALAVAAALAALLVPFIAATRSLPQALVLTALFALCFNGLMPVYDALALERLGLDGARYGRLRLWGSIGYVVASLAVGPLVRHVGVRAIPLSLVLCLLATAALCLGLRGTRRAPRDEARVAAVPGAGGWWFLGVCFLHLVGFAAYYGFYSLYLAEHGFSEGVIGALWALGVLAEIAFFFAAAPLVRGVSAKTLLLVALGVTVLRWLAIAAFPDSLAVLALAQVAHLAGFALFHTVSVLIAPGLLGTDRERAQALVSSAGWGAGLVVGSALAGGVWQALGPRMMYVMAALVTLLAGVVAQVMLSGSALAAATSPARAGESR